MSEKRREKDQRMAWVAQLYSDDVRGAERRSVEIDGTLRGPARTPHDVLVTDLSASGFRIPAAVALPVGSQVTLGLSGVGARAARVVRVTDGGELGCEFVSPLSPQELSLALAGRQALIPFPIAYDPIASDDLYADELPEVTRFPGPVRVAILIGGGILAWAATIVLAVVLF